MSVEQARQQFHNGDFHGALKFCEQALKGAPNDVEALFIGHLAARRLGQAAKARRLLKAAAKAQPENPEIWYHLGDLAQEQRELAQALEHFRRASELAPQSPELLNRLGGVLVELNESAASVAAFEAAIALKPDFVNAVANLSLALIELEQWEGAHTRLRQALDLTPDDPYLTMDLGRVLIRLDRPWDALECYRHAVGLQPGETSWRIALARLLGELYRYSEAEQQFAEALESEPDSPVAAIGLARLYAESGEAEKSLALMADAVGRAGDAPALLFDAAMVFAELGRFEEAETHMRTVLALDPNRVTTYLPLVSVIKYRPNHPDIAAMRALADDESYAPPKKWRLHMALANALDQIGDYDAAFAQYAIGNALVRSSIDYDADLEDRALADTAALFDAATVGALAPAASPSELPVFILGMPRSGTSLVEQVLSSHPEIHGIGESAEFIRLTGGLAGRLRAEAEPRAWLAGEGSGDVADLGRSYVERVRGASATALRITDKNPHNHVNIGVVLSALPNARIVQCVRDPVDTCFSCFQQAFADSIGYAWDLSELGRYHLAYERLMAHWNAIGGDRILRVSYEDLVGDPEPEIRRLVEFCGVAWNDICLHSHTNPRVVKTASIAQVRAPIYRTSVKKWQRYEKHLGPLLSALEGR